MSNIQIAGILTLALPLMVLMLPQRGRDSLFVLISRMVGLYIVSVIIIAAMVAAFSH